MSAQCREFARRPGGGDVGAILAKLAGDVEWEYGVNSTDVPWLQPRRGRDQVAGFFQSLAALDFHAFQPTAFLESGPLVVSLVTLEGTVRATGRRMLEEDEVHIWRFKSAMDGVSRKLVIYNLRFTIGNS